jgi:hypothetical protein
VADSRVEAGTRVTVSESEGLVYIRQSGAVGFDSIQCLRENWNRLLDAAQLSADERAEAVRLFNSKVLKMPAN